ncbi:hypothetical protein A4H97_10730 [Niastella yeongjuensis]|uniref:Uncharacterized protein n=1 Tax=Niastella yeongjuensis TaxID=354355 RepID=A0A1V9EFA6_9BACT|nr:hypothetical protein [Niastella yeongjuensis]OQP44827.1 hypothetical protein A4H97_10730 [Niastella yeongjuensis]SEP42133.1 hypothetical protein SAMN05660816_05952 [Niastella yeongjuensis]
MNNSKRNIPRHLILLVSILLLLISSCPIKKGIISLVHIHTETESSSPKDINHFAAYLADTCEKSESADTNLTQLKSVSATDYLPVLLFITAFLALSFGNFIRKTFPRYWKYNILTDLSLFLQHRRLII